MQTRADSYLGKGIILELELPAYNWKDYFLAIDIPTCHKWLGEFLQTLLRSTNNSGCARKYLSAKHCVPS